MLIALRNYGTVCVCKVLMKFWATMHRLMQFWQGLQVIQMFFRASRACVERASVVLNIGCQPGHLLVCLMLRLPGYGIVFLALLSWQSQWLSYIAPPHHTSIPITHPFLYLSLSSFQTGHQKCVHQPEHRQKA